MECELVVLAGFTPFFLLSFDVAQEYIVGSIVGQEFFVVFVYGLLVGKIVVIVGFHAGQCYGGVFFCSFDFEAGFHLFFSGFDSGFYRFFVGAGGLTHDDFAFSDVVEGKFRIGGDTFFEVHQSRVFAGGKSDFTQVVVRFGLFGFAIVECAFENDFGTVGLSRLVILDTVGVVLCHGRRQSGSQKEEG